MVVEININDIYDKNLNFLIGSGASAGLFPTLALKIKCEKGTTQTIETLAKLFENDRSVYTMLFMHYYKTCIEPIVSFELNQVIANPSQKQVVENYRRFIETILTILDRKQDPKSCNIFTGNYDGCFAHITDDLLKHGHIDFMVNDGTRGFFKRHLQARNFNSYLSQTGIFGGNCTVIPQINLIHLHGSIYWKNEAGDKIIVDYAQKHSKIRINDVQLQPFSDALLNEDETLANLKNISLEGLEENPFWENYNKIPIVNPTKWKFHETVFEEHYYQMLRCLSYELEKQNTVLIAFGFSFADEHITNLIKRSLANKSLMVYIFCFNKAHYENIHKLFSIYKNVKPIHLDHENLDFSAFNEILFSSLKKAEKAESNKLKVKKPV